VTLPVAAQEHLLELPDEETRDGKQRTGKQRWLAHVGALSQAFALCPTDPYALEIHEDVAFFQVVATMFRKYTENGKSKSEHDYAVRQLVSKAVVTTGDGVIDVFKGRVYDPCCGSAGLFVQSEKFTEAHGGKLGDIAIYGQESNPTTWKLALMNLAIRGLDGNLGPYPADTFRNDLHPGLKADFILANFPFNVSDWFRKDDDVRWKYGVPPKGNANYAWIQHIIHHLAPNGVAGFVSANGAMSSNQSGEGEIRKAIIEADLVDCMVALPGQLFYSTPIPVCLWFLARNKQGSTSSTAGKKAGGEGRLRDRRHETLFIDARKLGTLIDRVHRELTDDDIAQITDTYHAWRGDLKSVNPGSKLKQYEDVLGFCRSATTEEIAGHGYILTPGRYVGAAEVEDDGEPFEEKMARLTAELRAQTKESARLDKLIWKNLESIGYGG